MSGIHGVEMPFQIFIGPIYYQRLRHMVSDKWQCRSMGPIDSLTRQPVKGRKRGGGVRFGEMERDSILAHGASALLQDRLLHSSDAHMAYVCPKCGSILSPHITGGDTMRKIGSAECKVCEVACRLVVLPFVFRYVCHELSAMNITIKIDLKEKTKIRKGILVLIFLEKNY
jgi:DNA-directed RNA polymerase I subunit RPA2